MENPLKPVRQHIRADERPLQRATGDPPRTGYSRGTEEARPPAPPVCPWA